MSEVSAVACPERSDPVPDRVLEYRFDRPDLLRQALTHRSIGCGHNECLEYLGDALLGFLVAEALYVRLPQAEEGELTLRRTALVCRETLAELAQEHQLDSRIQSKIAPPLPERLLADTVEALIAAVYLDSDIDACRKWVFRLYGQRLQAPMRELPRKDSKMALQEYLQMRRLPMPVYHLLGKRGELHEPKFVVSCEVAALQVQAQARAGSIRKAEQDAARQVLQELCPAGEGSASSSAASGP